MSRGRASVLLMVVFALMWAVTELLAADLLVRYSPYQVVWMRYGVHLIIMLLVFGWRKPASLWRTARPTRQLLRSMLMLGMPTSWVIANQHGVRPDTLMAVFWLSPLLIMMFAHLLLGERAPLALWVASALTCLGANLLFLHWPLPLSLTLLFPLAMALSFSLYVVMTRTLHQEALRVNLFYTALGVFVVLSPAMLVLWTTPSTLDLLRMVGVGLFGWLALYALDRAVVGAAVSLTAAALGMQLVFMIAADWMSGHVISGWYRYSSVVMLILLTLVLLRGEPKLHVRQSSGPWTWMVRGAP